MSARANSRAAADWASKRQEAQARAAELREQRKREALARANQRMAVGGGGAPSAAMGEPDREQTPEAVDDVAQPAYGPAKVSKVATVRSRRAPPMSANTASQVVREMDMRTAKRVLERLVDARPELAALVAGLAQEDDDDGSGSVHASVPEAAQSVDVYDDDEYAIDAMSTTPREANPSSPVKHQPPMSPFRRTKAAGRPEWNSNTEAVGQAEPAEEPPAATGSRGRVRSAVSKPSRPGWNNDFADDRPLEQAPPAAAPARGRPPSAGRAKPAPSRPGWNSDFTDDRIPAAAAPVAGTAAPSAGRRAGRPRESAQASASALNDIANAYADLGGPSPAAQTSTATAGRRAPSASRRAPPAAAPSAAPAVEDQPIPTMARGGGGGGGFGGGGGGDGAAYNDGSQPIQLAQCGNCGRKFARDRLARHESACANVSKPRRTFDAAKMRVAGTEAAAFVQKRGTRPQSGARGGRGGAAGGSRGKGAAAASERAINGAAKKAKWRAEHEAFIANIRNARQVTQAIKSGVDVRDLPPPPPSAPDPSLVPCPHCGRTFNETAAERHIPRCKTTINRPKALRR